MALPALYFDSTCCSVMLCLKKTLSQHCHFNFCLNVALLSLVYGFIFKLDLQNQNDFLLNDVQVYLKQV